MTFFDREVEVNGKTLKISQQYVGDVGGVVWDSALVLNGFLENISGKIKGKNILELGAGTGVTGLIAAYFGARVSITDTAEFLPLIEKNIEQNKELIKLSPVYPFCLDWRYFDENEKLETPEHVTKKLELPFDIIILSDCIYYEPAVNWLFLTLKSLAKENCEIYMSMEYRPEKVPLVKEFFEKMKSSGFKMSIEKETVPEELRCPDIDVFKFVR
ncbi:unnamed protein product [Oikopleura dioica]|uniref:Uncharacterized protein n=1 Tax=Oikopleura dioica TaxID=34765 RepID=E4XFJ3_OIKDI|nr:unnamed protein product [Oikopleura dioica]